MTLAEHTTWELESALRPGDVLAALVHFGPDRTRIWTETTHPKVYRVHEVGPTWAVVTEGVPSAWSRERYDWARPGIVTLSQLDSNVALPGGTITYTIAPAGSGSRVICDRVRTYVGTPDGLLAGIFMRLVGRLILRWQFARGLARAEALAYRSG
jgi:hypothetical protein